MSKNHHWRCGAINKIDGRACKNVVRFKGEQCYRHAGTIVFPDHTEDILPSVTLAKSMYERDNYEVVQAHQYICDSCGRLFLTTADEFDGPPYGYHGTVFVTDDRHGNSATYFICIDCGTEKLKDGISSALDKSWDS